MLCFASINPSLEALRTDFAVPELEDHGMRDNHE